MTHREWLHSAEFEVIAETENAIYFKSLVTGEEVAEINGEPFDCHSVEEFNELVEFWGDEDFAI